MLAMSTTEGPIVPSRTARSVFLPDALSSNSNFLSLIRLQFLGGRAENGQAAGGTQGGTVRAPKSRHGIDLVHVLRTAVRAPQLGAIFGVRVTFYCCSGLLDDL